ncbi:MAG: uvrD [Parachlamydiales bacterium]|nr:uvrD [Parachlamydiales bacterium]
MSLNPEQEKAVRSSSGRVLLIAGAGSGKTRVIVHRIAYIVRQMGQDPESILGMTFTNKAAAEMRYRVQEMIGSEAAKKVTLCTFHSFCMQILRKEIHQMGYTRDFSLYDERDMRRLIGSMAREMLNHEGELPSLEPTYAALAQASQRGLRAEEDDEEKPWHDTFSKDLYGRMQSTLRAYNAVSFDSLITLAIQLFEEHPSILSRYQDRYRYLMIDEYQDTNPAQMRLAELLASRYRNLCVVGDDDQSIYGWRGADIRNILDFKADTMIKLEQNYRSTPQILAAANAVIQNNTSRHKKNLWTSSKTGGPIEVFHAQTDIEEAQAVIDRIVYYRQEKQLRWRDMAILYRSNALSRQLENALINASWNKDGQWVRGIPYEVFGGLAFAERSEIKDILAYLRFIANPQDSEALLRIINVPRRGISDTFLDTATQQNRSTGTPLWSLMEQIASGNYSIGTSRAQGAVRSFVSLIEKYRRYFHEEPLSVTTAKLVEEIQYKRAIEDEVKSETMRQFKWENVQECINALAQYEQEQSQQNEKASLQDFISNTTLVSESIKQKAVNHADNLQLMTLHSAKGLEFPACFIIGLEDHILPHEKSLQQTGLEEERRLFYVGITRAQRHLTLSMARTRLRNGKGMPTNPSRFLFEIPKDLIRVTTPKSFA